jgi:hypothetical protein
MYNGSLELRGWGWVSMACDRGPVQAVVRCLERFSAALSHRSPEAMLCSYIMAASDKMVRVVIKIQCMYRAHCAHCARQQMRINALKGKLQ